MNINRDNYEIYFLDFLEGQLPSEDTDALLDFLNQNPDLKEEFNGLKDVTLTAEEVVFTDKKPLKKTDKDRLKINDANFNKYCVGKIEGDLDIKQANELNIYLKTNQKKQKELSLFEKTILEADTTIKYHSKAELRRLIAKRNIRRVIIAYASVAAAVVIFILGFINFDKLNVENNGDENIAFSSIDSKALSRFFLKSHGNSRIRNIEIDLLETNHLITNKEHTLVSPRKRKTVKNAIPETIKTELNKIDPIANKVYIVENIKDENDVKQITVINRDDTTPLTEDQIEEQDLMKLIKGFNNDEYIAILNQQFEELKNANPKSEQGKFNFWQLADKLFGDYVEIKNSYDEKGNVSSLAINTKGFAFSKKIRK